MRDRSASRAWWREVQAKERKFDRIVAPARKSFEKEVATAAGAKSAWSSHFGVTGIDPKHLFVYFVVPTDAHVDVLANSEAWEDIRSRLSDRLAARGYPVDCLPPSWLHVFSQQTCDEKFQGSWSYFFK